MARYALVAQNESGHRSLGSLIVGIALCSVFAGCGPRYKPPRVLFQARIVRGKEPGCAFDLRKVSVPMEGDSEFSVQHIAGCSGILMSDATLPLEPGYIHTVLGYMSDGSTIPESVFLRLFSTRDRTPALLELSSSGAREVDLSSLGLVNRVLGMNVCSLPGDLTPYLLVATQEPADSHLVHCRIMKKGPDGLTLQYACEYRSGAASPLLDLGIMRNGSSQSPMLLIGNPEDVYDHRQVGTASALDVESGKQILIGHGNVDFGGFGTALGTLSGAHGDMVFVEARGLVSHDNEKGGIVVYDPQSSWSKQWSLNGDCAESGIISHVQAIGDVDQDGWCDLAYCNQCDQSIRIISARSGHVISRMAMGPAIHLYEAVGCPDMDGDGISDLLVSASIYQRAIDDRKAHEYSLCMILSSRTGCVLRSY